MFAAARHKKSAFGASAAGSCCNGQPAASMSIIVPALNEAEAMIPTLMSLQPVRGRNIEVIVVDGGSADDTRHRAAHLSDRVEVAPRGRASQMNAGASIARGDVLLFLHADTKMPANGIELVRSALADANRVWGRFDVRINSQNRILRLVARMINLRSRVTGIATGDQAIFVRRSAFELVGGYPDIPLMEDIALSRALRRLSRPACLSTPVVTSGRRWQQRGIIRTIFLMWRLRLAYFCGADPADLAVSYGYVPRND